MTPSKCVVSSRGLVQYITFVDTRRGRRARPWLAGVTEEIRAGFNPLAVGRKILREEGESSKGWVSPPRTAPPGGAPGFGGYKALGGVEAGGSGRGGGSVSGVSRPGVSDRGGFAAAGGGYGMGEQSTSAAARHPPPSPSGATSSSAAHLPFSAVSVGRARIRPEISGGADILLDGIIEAEVAAKVGFGPHR